MPRDADLKWLLLIHQLPAKPAYVRVKIWRRLQALGAVTVKNAVYALPANSETREDFAWLAKEIVESEGEAIVCEANFIEGLSDRDLRGLFDGARDEDYGRIAGEARELGARLAAEATDAALALIGADFSAAIMSSALHWFPSALAKAISDAVRSNFFTGMSDVS